MSRRNESSKTQPARNKEPQPPVADVARPSFTLTRPKPTKEDLERAIANKQGGKKYKTPEEFMQSYDKRSNTIDAFAQKPQTGGAPTALFHTTSEENVDEINQTGLQTNRIRETGQLDASKFGFLSMSSTRSGAASMGKKEVTFVFTPTLNELGNFTKATPSDPRATEYLTTMDIPRARLQRLEEYEQAQQAQEAFKQLPFSET